MVTKTPASLPETNEGLRALVFSMQSELENHAAQNTALSQTVDEYKFENDRLAEYVRLLKSKYYGPSSERSGTPAQLGLFNEAEALLDEVAHHEEEGDGFVDRSAIELPVVTRFASSSKAKRDRLDGIVLR